MGTGGARHGDALEPGSSKLARQELHLYGAGVDSGTYDYFTEAVIGTQRSSRTDFASSEDDDKLVKGGVTSPR